MSKTLTLSDRDITVLSNLLRDLIHDREVGMEHEEDPLCVESLRNLIRANQDLLARLTYKPTLIQAEMDLACQVPGRVWNGEGVVMAIKSVSNRLRSPEFGLREAAELVWAYLVEREWIVRNEDGALLKNPMHWAHDGTALNPK